MRQDNRIIEAVILAFLVAVVLLWAGNAWSAETIDTMRLVSAIKRAENSYRHPYGILKDYCKAGDPDGQCRKGCVQTINKWKSKLEYSDVEGFLKQFANIYAPCKGASNDPNGLNKNWYKNTLHFYKQSL